MTDLTAVDILIEPDAASIERARAVNRRMPLSVAAGITLDDTHASAAVKDIPSHALDLRPRETLGSAPLTGFECTTVSTSQNVC